MPLSDWKKEFPVASAALEKARANHRIGQAYLLTGDNPELLADFAEGWAMTAACMTHTADGAACGQCPSCKAFANGSYTEICRIAPQSKARQITKEAVNEFLRQMTLTVPAGMLKVGLISEADCMNSEAQNAFLKTLEEPSDHTMMLLTTTNPLRLLPTIHSRCQRIKLLKNRIDFNTLVSPDFLQLLATIHRGAGSRAAFSASAALADHFATLKDSAKAAVEESWDPQLDALAADAPKQRELLKKQKEERIHAEYLRLRQASLECLQSWFQQRFLIATGVPTDRLPQQEFLAVGDAASRKPPTTAEAEEDMISVQKCLTSLQLPLVPEDIALDAFCLEICRKA